MTWIQERFRALRAIPQQASLYSTIVPIDNQALREVPKKLFGRDLPPDAMRTMTRQALEESQVHYQAHLPEVIETLLREPLREQRDALRATRDQRVYVMPALPLAHGHAVAVIAFAPVDKSIQEKWISEPNLMRFVVASFAGGGAAFTEEMRRDALRAGGSKPRPRNVARPLPSQVVTHNAQLFRDKKLLSGVHLLGSNSWCTAKMHLVSEQQALAWQSVAWVTTDIHSQDGTVLWQIIRHPACSDSLIWLSIHYGDHQVPLGDTINAWLAPLLFHPTFERAMRLAEIYPELEREWGAAAAELLLNEKITSRFETVEGNETPQRRRQLRLLHGLDLTGGFLLTAARFLRSRDNGRPNAR